VKKFTDNAIRELPVEGRDRLVFERMTPGFGVRVTPAGNKIFLAQAPRQAGAKRTSVGVFPDKLVADAGQDAKAVLDDIRNGRDAIAERATHPRRSVRRNRSQPHPMS
jgi:hypothetical protein